MTRLLALAALLGFFADVLRRAVIAEAASLLLPLLAILIVLLVLIVRQWRRTFSRIRKHRTDFIRPRSFPEQPKRDIR